MAFDLALSAELGAVNGFVRDAGTGEPLAYANVYLEKTGLGEATNERGYFVVRQVPAGEYELVASFVGYEPLRRAVRVTAGRTLTLNLELAPGAVELREVRVTAERARFEREVEVSATRLETRQLMLAPRVGGELDLFRTIQLLPGVVSTSDFSNRLYIRGGSPDQNLILLDGITVYNPSHLFGLFSPFIPEAVSDATLLAGGFPAKYGGRLSSVLDVTTREGNSRRLTGDGTVSVIAAKGLVEGPLSLPIANRQSPIPPDSGIGDWKSAIGNSSRGSFLVAGRRTYLPDLLLAAFGVEGLGYYFYDLMGKANYVPGPDSRFTVAGIGAEDVLSFWDPENRSALEARLRWGNRGVSARWNRVFNPILYGEVLGAWSNFQSNFDVRFAAAETARFRTDLTDWTLKSDFTWYRADRHTLDLGVDASLVRIAARFTYDTLTVAPEDTLIQLALYADEKWEVLPGKLFLKPGLRLAAEARDRRFEPEPRLSVKYRFGANTALSGAVGRFTQPMVTLNSTEGVFSVYDVWLSVPKHRRLPGALHFITGIEHWLREDVIVEAETYCKDYADLLETRYGDFFTPPDSLLAADGYSLGAELMLRKTRGPVSGWLGYSFMWTRRNVGPETYHPHYDRRHNLNLVASLPALFWGCDISAKWSLGTGLPYAGTLGYFHEYQYRPGDTLWLRNPEWGFIEGPRDAFRYPVYHRLDAGLSRSWHPRWGEITAFLDVANLYNARNVLLYYWEPGADRRPVRRTIGMIPILPTLGVEVRF